MKKKSLAMVGISALGLALVGSAAANAYSGPSGQNNISMTGRDFKQDKQAEMQKLLDTTDFQTWKGLISKNPRSAKLLEVINESNFSKFIEMQKLLMSGDKAGAEAIRVELGLPTKIDSESKSEDEALENDAMGRGHFDKWQNQAVQTAIDNNDFIAWQTAVKNTPMGKVLLEKINASNFSQYVQMNKLMKSGDKAGAQAIAKDLGFKSPMFMIGHSKMMKHWMKNNKSTT